MKKPWVLITSGDVNGIGPEVTVKALSFLGPQKSLQFAVFKSKRDSQAAWKKLGQKFKLVQQTHFPSKLPKLSPQELLVIESELAPPFWVEQAARICLSHSTVGICTAPLSKELIRQCGMKDRGHTEILKRVTGTRDLHMGFWGPHFSVVLATDHIPLREVSKALRGGALRSSLKACEEMKSLLAFKKSRKFFILGLNPHAGNSGIIGKDEMTWMNDEILDFQAKLGRTEGGVSLPIPADSAFNPKMLRSKPLYLALYHDQGLIPFKMMHGFGAAVHLTLGLPFLRTSVDHGTAFDIFGKNLARPESMISALQFHLRRKL